MDILNIDYDKEYFIIHYKNLLWKKQELFININSIIDNLYNYGINNNEIENIKKVIEIIFNDIINWTKIIKNLYKQMSFVLGDIKLIGNNIKVNTNISWLGLIKKNLKVSIYDNNDDTTYVIQIDIPWFFSTEQNWVSEEDITWIIWIINTIINTKTYNYIQEIEKQISIALKNQPILICECNKDNNKEKIKIYWKGEIKYKMLSQKKLSEYDRWIDRGWIDNIDLKMDIINKDNNRVTITKDITLEIVKYWNTLNGTVNDIVKDMTYTKYNIPEMSIKGDLHFDFNLFYPTDNKIKKIESTKEILTTIFN